MINSPIHIARDFKSDASSVTSIGVSPNIDSSLLAHDRLVHDVISLIEDSDSERVSKNSYDEKASSRILLMLSYQMMALKRDVWLFLLPPHVVFF